MAEPVSSRSGSMSWRTISLAASSGNVRMSPRRFFVNSTLPAPMNTIRGLMRGVFHVGYIRARVRTTAESRALQQLTTEDGWLAIVANDQRQSLVALRERAGLPATAEELRRLKADIVEALGPDASGV